MVDTKVHDESEFVIDPENLDTDDDLELEAEESRQLDKIKLLREKLKQCDEERIKYLEDTQRIKADFLNSRRRLEEQSARDRERAVDKLLIELLTLADSFSIATGDKEWPTLDQKWKNGIEAIEAKLSSILKSNNITPIDPLGAPFNPEEHEAVSNSSVTDDAHVDTIIAVLQKGYRRGNDIIRPARVVVGTK